MAGTVTAQVRLALQSLGAVGAQSPAGLRGLLSSALSEVHAPSVGDATGFGGLGLHGRDNGGGGETIGVGGLATRGRATGDSTYGRISNGLNPRRAPVAVVIDDTPPEVIGGLDMELIREVIHRQRAQIRYCYESQLGRAPTLQGKVLLKFVIGALFIGLLRNGLNLLDVSAYWQMIVIGVVIVAAVVVDVLRARRPE